MADYLEKNSKEILEANNEDYMTAEKKGISKALLSRLKLTKEKLNSDIRWSYQVDALRSIKSEYNKQVKREGIGAYPAKIWLDFDKNLNYNLF